MHRLLVLVAIVVLGCGDFGAPRQLVISLQAIPSTAAVGDTITLVATAEGSNLFGVEMTYGDGASDQYNTGGAKSAQISFRHAYQAVGTYQVQATATDARAGTKTASLSVTVQ